MRLENTPELHTPRLLLRRFRPEDAPAYLALMGDEETNAFLPWFPLRTLEEAWADLARRFLATYRQPSGYHYAICEKGREEPIGYVQLSEGEAHDFGYAVHRGYWGRGIATEACRAVVQRLRQAGLPYITATHDVKNPASGGVMRRIGMGYRYTYREQWQPKNMPVDFRMYQKDLDGERRTFLGYWEKFPGHWIERGI